MTSKEIDVGELFHEDTKVAPYQLNLDDAALLDPLEPGTVAARFRLPKKSEPRKPQTKNKNRKPKTKV